jgi:malate dehydrogenase (oxaloacetate-decarboxylating)
MLFKALANVDAFPICVHGKSVDHIIDIAKSIEPVFGGFNLEDISAPRCFEIERRLQEEVNVPVFHDDQHGTAVVTLAALYNSLKLTGKKIDQIKVVVSGAGAAGIACSKIFMLAGVKNIIICDRTGAVYRGRTEGMKPSVNLPLFLIQIMKKAACKMCSEEQICLWACQVPICLT